MQKLFLSGFFLLVALSTILSQKVNFSGWGNIGYVMYNNGDHIDYYEGKLKTDIKFNDKIFGQFYIKGSDVKPVALDELTIQFNLSNYFSFKVGNAKKIFGYEYITAEEELKTIERSIVQDSLASSGYGNRRIGLIGFYKYSANQPEFPFSYYLSLFKEDPYTTDLSTRLSYHIGSLGIGIDYMHKYNSDTKISSNGFGGGFFLENKIYYGLIELFYTQNPIGYIMKGLSQDYFNVNSLGARLVASYNFKCDFEYLKGIEPVVLLSYNKPNESIVDYTYQFVGGINFYLQEKIRARINGDLRSSNNDSKAGNSKNDSRITISVQMIF